VRAFRACLLDEAQHSRSASRIAAFEISVMFNTVSSCSRLVSFPPRLLSFFSKEYSPKNISAVINALNGYLVSSKIRAQSAEERRAGYVTDVARFVGAAGEDHG